jgi:hypothetical protein
VTYFDSINRARLFYKKHLCQQPVTANMRVFVCLLSVFALCQGNNCTTTLGLHFTVSAGRYCQRVRTSTATQQINVRLTKGLCGYEVCDYITYIDAMLLAVPSPHHGSCAYHVSGSVLCCLSRNKYTINTPAKTNKILLTSRQLHYLTQTHIQDTVPVEVQ